MTALDEAHAWMMEDEGDEGRRLAFFGALRAAEIFVLLEAEPVEDKAELLVMETSDGPVALAFDTEARLADFIEAPTPYLGLSGRRLAGMLAGNGVALGLNLGVAPSSILLEAASVDWLAESAPDAPDLVEAAPESLGPPPGQVPEPVLRAVDAALARLAGIAEAGWLAEARYAGGAAGVVLALSGVAEAERGAVAEAIAEALHFSGVEAAALDVMFPQGAVLAVLEEVGLRFDIPELPPVFKERGDAPPRLI